MIKIKQLIFPIVTLVVVLILGVFSYLVQVQGLLSSKAYLKLDNSQVKVDFKIMPQDQLAAREFSQNLGLNFQSLSLKFDDDTTMNLKNYLPMELNLKISPKELQFSNQSLKSAGDYQIKLADPAKALMEATQSGQFYLSPILESLFPILEKVATIDLSAGRSVSGDVKLK